MRTLIIQINKGDPSVGRRCGGHQDGGHRMRIPATLLTISGAIPGAYAGTRRNLAANHPARPAQAAAQVGKFWPSSGTTWQNQWLPAQAGWDQKRPGKLHRNG